VPLSFPIACNSDKDAVLRSIRKTYKKFTMLKKNVSNGVINTLMNFDFKNRVRNVLMPTKCKWEARKSHTIPTYPQRLPSPTHPFAGTIFPRALRQLLNLSTALCPRCPSKVACSSSHMLNQHNVYIPDHDVIFKKIQGFGTCVTGNGRGRRKKVLNLGEDYVRPFINYLQMHLNAKLDVSCGVS